MRRICVVLTTRGNFGKAKTIMQAIVAHPDLQLQLVVGGSLLNRQAALLNDIRAGGFEIAAYLDYMLAAETTEAIATSAGLCLIKMTDIIERLRPDVVLIIADRYEALAIAQAALCLNVRIAHLEGGEVSGSIDERIRHAVSKLSHYHFPANTSAADRLVRMGEDPASVVVAGSPSFDVLLQDRPEDAVALQAQLGDASFDLDAPFLLVSQHPVVTEYADAENQYQVLAESIVELGMPAIWIWPNNDAGAAALKLAVERMRNRPGCPPCAMLTALPIEAYGAALRSAACIVGNSSSGIREAALFGTPAVNIGTRQTGRDRAANVVDAPCQASAIVAAVRKQVAHGRYPPDRRYGDGAAGLKIAKALADHWPSLDKTIAY